MGKQEDAEIRFFENFSGLYRDHRDQWVAFDRDVGVLGAAQSLEDVDELLEPLGVVPDTFVIHRMVPWLAPIIEMSPDIESYQAGIESGWKTE